MGWISSIPSGSMPPSPVGEAKKTCVQSGWVLKRRKSRVRSGTCGHSARESRVSQRENARFPTPLSACSKPSITISLGHRTA